MKRSTAGTSAADSAPCLPRVVDHAAHADAFETGGVVDQQLLAGSQNCVVGSVSGDVEISSDPRDGQPIDYDSLERLEYGVVGQHGAGLGCGRGVLTPHRSAVPAAVTAASDSRRCRPPAQRDARKAAGDGAAGHALLTTSMAPVIGLEHAELQHRTIRLDPLPNHGQTTPVKLAEDIKDGRGEGSVGHVEVFQMASVGTSIIGMPPRQSQNRRAATRYTLISKEPVKQLTARLDVPLKSCNFIRHRLSTATHIDYATEMTFSASRLTCYALISAIESDIRAAVERWWPDLSLSDVSEQVVSHAQERRAKDRLTAARTIGALLPYTDFADGYALISCRRNSLNSTEQEGISILTKSFDRLVAIRNQVAHTKPMRLDDAAFVADQSEALVRLDRGTWSTVAETMKKIGENPAYVLGLTPIWRLEEPPGTPFNNLPSPEFDETGFFGRRDELKKLKKLIKGNYPIVSVLGTGGIGKTALTLEAAYELLADEDRPFEAIVWVTAKSAVLTNTEIVSITNAIKDSLGLFSQAAEFLGGQVSEDPIADLKQYLETFKVLLILDNLETVLDSLLRDFLSDIPIGSKVIVTSRISLGMLDNPIALSSLSPDDAVNLLYALCRVRGVSQLKNLTRDEVAQYAVKMSGHPSYIRWFVAGLQSGKRPEDLLGASGLILRYCMSNVYDYLGEQERDALGVFQVLPGVKNMAELAYLNGLTGEETERILLVLLTTNFVSMSSRSSGGHLDSTYFLSDFAKEYLDSWHPIARSRRVLFLSRNQELRDQGAELSVEMAATPYSPTTITIRGVEDAHVARLLKKAVFEKVDEEALRLCMEAQKLAPHHSEAYRVEAEIRSRMFDDSGTINAFERALALSDLASTRYHYASYLLTEGIELRRSLELFQEAARRDESSSEIASQITWVQYLLSNWVLSISAAKRVLDLHRSSFSQRSAATVVALRAAHQEVTRKFNLELPGAALEVAEEAVDLCETIDNHTVAGESVDLLRLLSSELTAAFPSLKGFYQSSAKRLLGRLTVRIEDAEPGVRRIISQIVRLVPDKGFGFLDAHPEDYFLHVSQLVDKDLWESLIEGEKCVFEPKLIENRWKAVDVRVLRL